MDSDVAGEVGAFTIDVTSNVPVELSRLTVESRLRPERDCSRGCEDSALGCQEPRKRIASDSSRVTRTWTPRLATWAWNIRPRP